MNVSENSLGKAVRQLREITGKTQDEFAKDVGEKQSGVQISKYERGQPIGPKALNRLKKIAEENNQPQIARVFSASLEAKIGGIAAESAPAEKIEAVYSLDSGNLSSEEADVIVWWREPGAARGLRDFVRVWLSSRPETKSGQTLIGKSRALQDYGESNNPRMHILLEAILNSGNQTFVSGITSNLESWGEVVMDEARRSSGTGENAAALSPDIAADIERANRLLEYGVEDDAEPRKTGKRRAR